MSGLRPLRDSPLYCRQSDKSGQRFPDKTFENPARSSFARTLPHQSLENLVLYPSAVLLYRRDACSPVSLAVYPLCAPYLRKGSHGGRPRSLFSSLTNILSFL